MADAQVTAIVAGVVQGVGFRWFVRKELTRLGLTGAAENLPDGTVAVDAYGRRERCEQLVDVLRAGHRTPGRTDSVHVIWH